MPRELQDMVVVITGASAGIGRELAVQLARHGARLAIAARRVDRLELLNRQIGAGHLVVTADVSRRDDCEMLIRAARDRFGRIDTLVCNAGYGIAKSVSETSGDEMLAIFRTNVFGTTDCIRSAVPIMRSQQPRTGERCRGQVMIVSSAAARRGLPFFGAYSATKSAQLSLAEALRVELAPERIAVTSVHPIGTDTEFFETAERIGSVKIPRPGRGEVRQSANLVARAMIRAIRKPRPEVWTFAPVRFALALGAVIPSVVDRVMMRYRGELDAKRDES
jgi:short-subunit dehydrogenase